MAQIDLVAYFLHGYLSQEVGHFARFALLSDLPRSHLVIDQGKFVHSLIPDFLSRAREDQAVLPLLLILW